MASEIRVNSITNRSGLGTVTFSDTGVVLSGVSTFSTGIVVAAGSASAPSISPSGDSNTGIFFPSPDTIAFAEGGVEALRINSSANIGIGTTSSPLKLTVVGNIKTGYEANTGLILGLTPVGVPVNDVNAYILWGDNASFGGENGDLIYIPRTSTTGAHRFYTGNTTPTEKFKIDSSGNVSINNGNLVFSTAGKGIDFSATANSSGTMTSELLADYEEGIFSPTAFGSSSAGTTTYGLQFGMYVKIGNLCHFQVRMQVTNMTGTGDLYLGGLPFNTISDTERAYASIAVGYLDNLSFGNVSDTHLVLYTQQNNNYVVVRSSGNNRTSTAVPVDSSFTILYGGTYRTA
jgi:hypothetical protein